MAQSTFFQPPPRLTLAEVAALTKAHLVDGARATQPVHGLASLDEAQPLKGRLYPEDIARMVLFLAADDSRMISGQDFLVDGGWAHG